jgi:hypothetical protein
LKSVSENALSAEINEATHKFLERLIESTHFPIARIENKRMYWQEIERKKLMKVLESVWFITDSQYDKVHQLFFHPHSLRTNSKLKNLQSIVEARRESSRSLDIPIEQTSLKELNFHEKLRAIDLINPPLSRQEISDIAQQKESKEICLKLAEAHRYSNALAIEITIVQGNKTE